MSHPIPTAALDDRLAFVGNAGGGKTYSAGTAVERLLNSGARVVIPDPLGVWWGLALDADGTTPSIFRKREDLVIFGGPRGDLPLNEHAGALIGEAIAGMKESCILDLSELGTRAGEKRFMLAVLAALYKHKTQEPLHVIFDEADMWAPQRILDKEGEAMKLLGMMETIVRRGRVKGFIPWLITQRPAVLSKNVLSQIDGMVSFKLTSVQDRDAIGDWVEGQADKAQWREMWANMATLERGQGVVWIPGRAILKTAQFPKKITFDSSRAPKRGERLTSAGELKPVNLDKLKDRLSKVAAETKANDPKALRSELARVSGELHQLRTEFARKPLSDPEAIKRAEERGFEQAKHKLEAAMERELRKRLKGVLVNLRNYAVKWREQIDGELEAVSIRDAKAEAVTFTHAAVVRPAAQPNPKVAPIRQPTAPPADGSYSRAQMRVLRSLAMWRALGHEAPSREMVAAVAGYSPSSGGFNNLLGGLGTMGAIGKPSQGRVSLLVDVEVMSKPEGVELFLSSLNNPKKKIIGVLVSAGARSRDDVAQGAGYSPSSGGFNNLLGSLSTLGVIVKPMQGCVELSEWAQELLAEHKERLAS